MMAGALAPAIFRSGRPVRRGHAFNPERGWAAPLLDWMERTAQRAGIMSGGGARKLG